MNKCELCKCTARMYCESDQARLCWSCDAKVHSANFLVAKHVRTLLCHSCKSITPWTASGDNLGRTMSLCQPCSTKAPPRRFTEKAESEEFESGSDCDDSEYDEESSDDNVDDDDNNQVVPMPLSMTLSSSPPVVSSNSSTSQDRSHIDINRSIKRSRDCVADLKSKDDDADSLSIHKMSNAVATCCTTIRPFKFTKLEINRVGKTSTIIPMAQQRINTTVSQRLDNGVEEDGSVQFDLNECPFD